MAVDIKDVEQVAQELQQKFDDFKAKNDKRVDAIEQEKGKLAGQVETLNGKLSELENLKSDLEKELLELKRPAGGAQNKLATEHKEAFVSFLRKGREDGLRDLERKALQVGTDEDGGYAVPEELDRNILNLLKDEVVMRQEPVVVWKRTNTRTATNPIPKTWGKSLSARPSQLMWWEMTALTSAIA